MNIDDWDSIMFNKMISIIKDQIKSTDGDPDRTINDVAVSLGNVFNIDPDKTHPIAKKMVRQALDEIDDWDFIVPNYNTIVNGKTIENKKIQITSRGCYQNIHYRNKLYTRLASDSWGIVWYRNYGYSLEFIGSSDELEQVYQETRPLSTQPLTACPIAAHSEPVKGGA